jgi:5'-3' exoribonuclease 4
MGIPSYYKKLTTVLPSLIKRSHPDATVDWLFMDFNCLIYHCLHRADTPVYPGKETQDEWETQFIECIVRYSLKVIRQVNPKHGVFFAIDGVVPMAKMRQQRLRRFKSVWLHAKDDVRGWDTNAITPGTLFMKKLHAGLQKMIQEKGKGIWYLSSSDEPGEGEHKIMTAWRTGNYTGSAAVYGLDADLIVLSLLGQLHTNQSTWLFREEIEKGKIAYDADGEEQMEWFSIDVLRDWLTKSTVDKRSFILDYGFAMSVLGNDFLPSSLGLKMRDDGHTTLLTVLQEMHSKRVFLIQPHTQTIHSDGLHYLFRILSGEEEHRIQKYIGKKMMFSRGAEEIGLGENNWPLHKVEETVLLDSKQYALDSTWKQKYETCFFSGNSIKRCVDEYLYGIQWIWAYYTGRMDDVCFNWYYPFSLPPLWEWLQSAPLPEFPNTILVHAHDIRPVEQLALVLPLESWSLIPPCKERRFPSLAPQFYPSVYSFESVGKRFFWECESLIPLPSIKELKTILS